MQSPLWPGPVGNATLQLLRMRTQAAVEDIAAVQQEAKRTFPALDPQVGPHRVQGQHVEAHTEQPYNSI